MRNVNLTVNSSTGNYVTYQPISENPSISFIIIRFLCFYMVFSVQTTFFSLSIGFSIGYKSATLISLSLAYVLSAMPPYGMGRLRRTVGRCVLHPPPMVVISGYLVQNK